MKNTIEMHFFGDPLGGSENGWDIPSFLMPGGEGGRRLMNVVRAGHAARHVHEERAVRQRGDVPAGTHSNNVQFQVSTFIS